MEGIKRSSHLEDVTLLRQTARSLAVLGLGTGSLFRGRLLCLSGLGSFSLLLGLLLRCAASSRLRLGLGLLAAM